MSVRTYWHNHSQLSEFVEKGVSQRGFPTSTLAAMIEVYDPNCEGSVDVHHRSQPCGQLQDHLGMATVAFHQAGSKESSKTNRRPPSLYTAHAETLLCKFVRICKTHVPSATIEYVPGAMKR